MSEYHVVEVLFTDEEILLESLKDMGFNAEVYNDGVLVGNNYGRGVKNTAHVVVKREQFGGMGDIGFERTSEGFVMHADDYDWGRYGSRFDLEELNKKYVEKKLNRYVYTNSNCNIFSRRENEKGQVEIQLRIT